MRPSGVRNKAVPVAQGEAGRPQGSIRSTSPKGAAAAGAVDATARPRALLITPSSGSPAMAAAWQLPQPSTRWRKVAARRRSLPVSPSAAQVAKEVRSFTAMSRLPSRIRLSSSKALKIGLLVGTKPSSVAATFLNRIMLRPPPSTSMDMRQGVWVAFSRATSSAKGRASSRPHGHVHAGPFVAADGDAARAVRHRVGEE